MCHNQNMKIQLRFLTAICLVVGFGTLSYPAPMQKAINKKKFMTATGTFEVKLTPQNDNPDEPMLARLLIDKQFHGDLEAISKGQMLSAGTVVKGSAGYVAIEKVSGTLHGHKGTFILQHTGTMKRGEPGLIVTVVPDSGTGELTGLTGKMEIIIADGKHSYQFAYVMAEKP